MARTTILDYLDNFQRHAREVAYVHRRGYRTQRWTLWRGAKHGIPLRARTRRARHRAERQGPGLGRELRRVGRSVLRCLLRGAIVVPIDKIATSDFALRVAQQVDAKLCVCSATQSACRHSFSSSRKLARRGRRALRCSSHAALAYPRRALLRSSSPPAPPPSRAVSSSRMATFSRTSSRSSARSAST